MGDDTQKAAARRPYGAVVIGWDQLSRNWATAASGSGLLEAIPPLEGVLLTDPASRSLAASDYGGIVHHEPFAVLRPLAVDDIVKIVNFARKHDIKVSMRGQGHSAYGQSQACEGIVIDSATLNRIHSIQRDRAVVDPGTLWRMLVLAAAAHNVTPPVLTDYLDLSVGGTLSMGGYGGGPMRHGTQVDNVLELQVVTGEGDLLTCSPTQRRGLFDATLAGLGQCGVIVRATVKMVPMPAMALMVRLRYDDLETNLADIAKLVRSARFDSFDQWAVWENGRWVYDFEAAAYFTPPEVPEQARLLDGLTDDRSRRVIARIPYLTWLVRFDPLVAASSTARYVLFNGILSEAGAPRFLAREVFSQTNKQLGADRVLFVPGSTRNITRPLLRVPEADVIFPFLIFRRTPDSDAELTSFLDANRVLYDRQVAVGGTRYPWDAIPNFTRRDWAQHFGSSWSFVRSAKRLYDPAGILGPGPGVFT